MPPTGFICLRPLFNHLTLFERVGKKIVQAYVIDFTERVTMSELTLHLFFHSFEQFLFYEKKSELKFKKIF